MLDKQHSYTLMMYVLVLTHCIIMHFDMYTAVLYYCIIVYCMNMEIMLFAIKPELFCPFSYCILFSILCSTWL